MRYFEYIKPNLLILAAIAVFCLATGCKADSDAPPAEKSAVKPIWLAVTRPMFCDAIECLAVHRRADGFAVIVSTQPVAEALGELPAEPAFIVLIGDSQSGCQDEPWYLPSVELDTYRWHQAQPERFVSDAAIGDLDSDMVPEVPVGRIAVRTVEHLERVIAKTIAHEQRKLTPNDLTFPIWAGKAEYGAIVDRMTTPLLLGNLRKNSPRWLRPQVIVADEYSSLCGWPDDQPSRFTSQLKATGLLATMIGHGMDSYFYSMVFDGRPIVYHKSYVELAFPGDSSATVPACPLAIIACYCGNFAGTQASLAESLLLSATGPAAVIAATAESHPLTN